MQKIACRHGLGVNLAQFTGIKRCRMENLDVSHIHVRYINPLPRNLGELLAGYDHVLMPEMNTGQFVNVIRAKYLIDAKPLNKVSGQPFKIREIETAIRSLLES
ncbi:MAG: hypothetical protein ACNYPE_13340 [Candidatus Azotimanducaceae bacterium WSBS_2022_MAG_OTU7]